MKCPICNSPLRDGAVFCPHCGTRVGRSFEFENDTMNRDAQPDTAEDDGNEPYRFAGMREETNVDDFEDFELDELVDRAEAEAVIPDKVEREMAEIVGVMGNVSGEETQKKEDVAPVRSTSHTPFTAQIREAGAQMEKAPEPSVPATEAEQMSLEEEITIAPDTGVMQPSAMELLKASQDGADIYQTRFGVPSKSQEVTGGMQEQTASEIARKMAQAQQAQKTMAADGLTAAEMLTSMNREKAPAPEETALPSGQPLTAQEMLRARQIAPQEEDLEAVPATEAELSEEQGATLPGQDIPDGAPLTGAVTGAAAAGAVAGAAVAASQIPAQAAEAGAVQAAAGMAAGAFVNPADMTAEIPEGLTPQQAAFYRQQQQMQQAFYRQQQQLMQQMQLSGAQGAPGQPGQPGAMQQPYGYPYGYGYPYPYNPYAAGYTNPAQAAEATAAGIAAESEESAAVFAAASGKKVVTPQQTAVRTPQSPGTQGQTEASDAHKAAVAGGAATAAVSAGQGKAAGPDEDAMAIAQAARASDARKVSKKPQGTAKKAKPATVEGDESKQRVAIYILAAVVGILVIIAFVMLFSKMRSGNTDPGADLADASVDITDPSGETDEMSEGAQEEIVDNTPETDFNALIAAGDYEEAIRAIDEAYRLNPSEDLVSYYTLAYHAWSDALLAEGDYEQAIRQLEEASRIDAENEEIKLATVNAYRDWAETFIQNGEYEEAIAKLDAAALKASDESVLTDSYVNAYLAWGQYYETEGDLEQALNVLNQGYGKTSSNDIARRYNEIAINADGTAVSTGDRDEARNPDDRTQDDDQTGTSSGSTGGGSSSGGSSSGGSSSGGSRGSSGGSSSGGSSGSSSGSASSGIGNQLSNIASASLNGNTSSVASAIRDSSFRSSANSLIQQYNGPISYDTASTSVGVYPVNSTLMVYVGNYSTSNLRTGTGTWYDATASETYVAKGPWSGDVPNGNFTATWTGSGYDVTYSGNVKNGLWDGTVNISWTDSSGTTSYTATAKNGIFTELGKDSDGYIMIAQNGDKAISVTETEFRTPSGIRGYGYAAVQ